MKLSDEMKAAVAFWGGEGDFEEAESIETWVGDVEGLEAENAELRAQIRKLLSDMAVV